MKGWKVLLVLGIVGMFVMPMMPATKAIQEGGIIYAEAYHNNGKKKQHNLTGWDHAALYIGYSKIVEADPHMENWTSSEVNNYPLNAATLHYKSYRAQYDQNHYGKVEESPLSEITSKKYCSDYKSPWIIHSKQYENWDNPNEITYLKKSSVKYGYYCSELVWAAYKAKANIDLDGKPWTPVVWPSDIEESELTHKYEP